MFSDSDAAKGEESKGSESKADTSDFDKRSETFVRLTRGIHW
jgi:hypothetical protein